MNLDEYKNKIQKYQPTKFSYFKENMKLLLSVYPQCYENLGMWRKLVSQTSLDPEQFGKVIETSTELKLPYSPIGYVINQLKKNKKKEELVHTLFGIQKLK